MVLYTTLSTSVAGTLDSVVIKGVSLFKHSIVAIKKHVHFNLGCQL